MEAKVKQSARYGIVMAFSGVEFVKYEWRAVPAGFEAQAERHELLETREPPAEMIMQPEAMTELAQPAEVKKTPGRKAGKAA